MPPRVKRFIQKWIISHRARKPVTQNELHEKLSPLIRIKQGLARWHVGKSTSDAAHAHAQQTIDSSTRHYALTRAFRAAGIFGTETRNELTPLIRGKKWNELREKIGERRTNRIRQTYGQITRMGEELVGEEYVRGISAESAPRELPKQLPVHGNLLAFPRKPTKKAA
jgi:hypothetical protein